MNTYQMIKSSSMLSSSSVSSFPLREESSCQLFPIDSEEHEKSSSLVRRNTKEWRKKSLVEEGSSESTSDMGETLRNIIRAASSMQKILQCEQCDPYLKKQLEFEYRTRDKSMPVEMQVYQTFLADR
jgi:hypothetical protein